jgi:transposase-like protein
MALDVKMRAKFRCKQCGRQFEEGDKNIQVKKLDFG